MSDRVAVGLVGAGGWADLVHAPTLAAGPQTRLAGVWARRPEAAGEWYEGAIGRTAAAGVAWQIWAMPAGGWVEIDDDADLEAAESLVGA